MNNEPVAWWCAKEYADSDMEGGHIEELEFNQPSIYDTEGLIWEKPLYTHPADLTDEEIMEISGGENLSEQVFFWNKDAVLKFARAILRKAQEI